jgi:hypothetical protein
MATTPDNEQRLRDAGMLKSEDPLEPPYQAVVDGLTPDEVDAIVDIKRRLDDADRAVGWDPASGQPPPASARFFPP